MMEVAKHLFSSDFMPHGVCVLWNPGIVWLHAISDGLIALSYFVIPVALFYFVRRQDDLPFRDGPRSLVISTRTLDTGDATMTVRDSGASVDPAVFDRLFDPFFTTRREGMGLSVSRWIVESHGGRLWASINDGPGASFHVSLPALS